MQNVVFDHNFRTKAHRMTILASRYMFLRAKDLMVPFVLTYDLELSRSWPLQNHVLSHNSVINRQNVAKFKLKIAWVGSFNKLKVSWAVIMCDIHEHITFLTFPLSYINVSFFLQHMVAEGRVVTSSRQTTKVKQRWAQSVLGWGTGAWVTLPVMCTGVGQTCHIIPPLSTQQWWKPGGTG